MKKALSANHAALMRGIEQKFIARSRDIRADEYHACQAPIGKIVLRPMPKRIPAMPVTIGSRQLTTLGVTRCA
jgi:hypothetical protein